MRQCSHCHKMLDESCFERGFSLCSECRLKTRNKAREVKAKEESETESKNEQIIERKIQSGDINAGLRGNPKFMTWESYKSIFKGKANFKTYLKDKEQFEKDNNTELDEDEQLILVVPATSPDCIDCRRQLLGLDKKDSLFVGIHHSNCPSCQKFYSLVFTGRISGVDLWSSPLG